MSKFNIDPSLATSYSKAEIISIGSAALSMAAAGIAAHLGLKNRSLNKELSATKKELAISQQRHGEAVVDSATDKLTKVLNRRGLENLFDHLKAQERTGGGRRSTDEPIVEKGSTLLAIDLDDFKGINTKLGHKGGDATLCEVADVLKRSVRSDTQDAVGRKGVVGRMGGDEFVIMLPATTPEEGLIVAERIRSNASIARANADETVIIPTLSIGVSGMDFGLSFEENLEHADVALYETKHLGKDNARIYQES